MSVQTIVPRDQPAGPASPGFTYTQVLPEKLSTEGPWKVRRHWRTPDRLKARFDPPLEHVRTMYDLLENALRRHGDQPYLGVRKGDTYTWMSYRDAGRARDELGSCLQHLGLHPRSTVGIYGINSPEWVLIDAACASQSIITVPLYDTLGSDAVRYICSHAELTLVTCSAQVFPILLQCIDECPTVRHVVVWGSEGATLPSMIAGGRCRVLSLEAAREMGQRSPALHIPPDASDIHTICYTSGTTGVPKGVVLTHGNLIANAAGLEGYTELLPTDTYISYLPLAHIYERINQVCLVARGCGIGFYRGDVLTLVEDIQALKPTIFASVPRLWNRIYDKVMAAVSESGQIAKLLFDTAFQNRLRGIERGQRPSGVIDAMWDRLVFSKIRQRLGGRVRLMITGASPISPAVFNFLRVCFCPEIMEGYGMTESSCVITLTEPGDPIVGHVGGPTPSMEVKLDDIPEMGYTNLDRPFPRGEICVRGPAVFQGYFKDEGQTRDVMDADGWLHTGDVGTWIQGGRLKIIDRKKNIFKLAQGEYIAPEKIEQVYQRCPLVQQCFVHGDSLRPTLVAIAVPDPEVFLPWAKRQGLGGDLAALCRDKIAVSGVLQALLQEGRAAELRGFEQVAAVTLVPEPFSVENGLLTPTFKIKRQQAVKAFEKQIDRMYKHLA